jgi:hypothetical protein
MYHPGNGMLYTVCIYSAIYPWVYQGRDFEKETENKTK